jgi:polysaccharide export outer membrane protein
VPLSTKGDRLLDVVAGAGGVRAAVSETFVRLSRGGISDCAPSAPTARKVWGSRTRVRVSPGRRKMFSGQGPRPLGPAGRSGRRVPVPVRAGLGGASHAPEHEVAVAHPERLADEQAVGVAHVDPVDHRHEVRGDAPFTEVQKVLGVFSTITAPVSAGASVYAGVR